MQLKLGYSCLLLLLAGCGQQVLYTGLPEKEANDMAAILLSNSINCEKLSGAESTWNISVDKSQFSQAVQLLNEAGYPKDTFSSLGDVFKKSGLVSSPTEERIRFMHALSDELAETLTHIHGVVTARVHIVLPAPVDNQLRQIVRLFWFGYEFGCYHEEILASYAVLAAFILLPASAVDPDGMHGHAVLYDGVRRERR